MISAPKKRKKNLQEKALRCMQQPSEAAQGTLEELVDFTGQLHNTITSQQQAAAST